MEELVGFRFQKQSVSMLFDLFLFDICIILWFKFILKSTSQFHPIQETQTLTSDSQIVKTLIQSYLI